MNHTHHHTTAPHTARPRRAPATPILCILAAILAAHAPARANTAAEDPPPNPTPAPAPGSIATIIDRELRARSIRIVGIDRSEITAIDDRGDRRSIPLTELIAIIPTRATPVAAHGVGAVVGVRSPDDAALQRRILAAESGFIETTDGQRLVGHPGASAGEAGAVLWVHPRLGQFRVELDHIRIIAFPGAGARALTIDTHPTDDILTLVNGDRLRGLIASLGDPVVVENDTGTAFEVARDSVAGAALANPIRPRAGTMVWLTDGTVVRIAGATSLAGDSIDILLESGEESAYSIELLRAIGLDAGRIIPLSDLAPDAQSGDPVRRTTPPIERIHHPDDAAAEAAPTLGAMDIRFPGPMSVRWSLPRSAERFAATAAIEPGTAPWGDCNLVVMLDGLEVLRERLHADRPVVAVNIPIRGQELTITIEPGNHGPINDRVVLHRPLLLLPAPR